MTIVQPVDFGENIGWLVIHTYSVESILGCLDVVDEQPVFWADAINKICSEEKDSDKKLLFISPEVDGWMFVVSKLLMEKGDDEAFTFSDFVARLSVVFGEVQAFANDYQGGYYHWVKAEDGSLQSCFAYSSLKKEVYCNTGKFDLSGLEKPEDVLNVAERWSINPCKLSEYESRGMGYLVEVSREEFKTLVSQFNPHEYLEMESEKDLDVLTLSKIEQSIHYYKKWSSLGYMGDYGLINLVLSYYISNQFDEAVDLLEPFLKDEPGNQYAGLLLEDIYKNLESENSFIVECKENTRLSFEKYIKAFSGFIEDDNLVAVEFLIDAIDLDPENPINYYFITEIFLDIDDYINAQDNVNKLIELGYDDEYLLSLLVHINVVLGEEEKAIQVNELIKSKNSDSLLYLCNKAEMFEAKAEYEQAVDVLTEAKEINSDFAEVYALLGSVLYLKGEVEKGLENFNKALSIDKSSSKALLGLAIHYLKEENYVEAEDYARNAVYYTSDNDTAYNLLGRSLLEQQKMDFALECFIKATTINEYDDSSLAHMAYIYNIKGLYVQADEFAQKALAVNPLNVVANKIKEIVDQQGKMESFEGSQYKFVVFMGVLIISFFIIWVLVYLYKMYY